MSTTRVLERVRTMRLNVCVVDLDALTNLKIFQRINKHLAPITAAQACTKRVHYVAQRAPRVRVESGMHTGRMCAHHVAQSASRHVARRDHGMSRGCAARHAVRMPTACKVQSHRRLKVLTGPVRSREGDHGTGFVRCAAGRVSVGQKTHRTHASRHVAQIASAACRAGRAARRALRPACKV